MAIQQVRVRINGVWTIATWNATTSKYEAIITAPSVTSHNLSGGYYPVDVEVTNTASTVLTKTSADATLGSSLRLVVKEKIKPTIAITSPGASSRLTNSTAQVVFQLRDEVNGSGVNIATLKFQFDSGAVFTNTSPGMVCTAVANGYDCVYTPQTALSDGPHTAKIDVSDFDGNVATQATRTYTIDTVPPSINVTAPTNMLLTNQSSLTVTGVTNDATSSPVTVTVKLSGADQGSVTVDGSGNFSKAITLNEGLNTIVVRATDAAGKYSEISRNVTLDTSVPVISAVSITPNPQDAGATVVVSLTVTG